MSKPNVPVFVSSVTWNSNTWNAETGGLQSVDFEIGSEPLEHWSGDDIYPRFVALVRKRAEIIVTVDHHRTAVTQGVKATLVFILKMADLTTTKTISLTNMKLCRVTLSQSEGVAGGTRLSFRYESDNGISEPVSEV